MTDVYSTPDDTGELRSSELTGSLGERLGAQASEAFGSGMRTFTRMREYRQAESGEETLGQQIGRLRTGEDLNQVLTPGRDEDYAQPPVDVPIADAKARIKQRGLDAHLTLPDQPTIRQPVLDLMLAHAQERRDYDAAVSRGPQGFFPGALGMITEIGAGMIDPVNIAAFSIPVLGEARWGQMLANAGESLTRRAGVKALQGGLQGAAGSAALIPGDWWLHTKDGQDYTMADALKSVVMGAGMGATFHAGFGSVGDLLARSRGQPLAGSPEDLVLRGLMNGTHVPGAALESDGLPEEEVPGLAPSGGEPQVKLGSTPSSPAHPAEILADLPPAAREDVARAAIADVIADRPVRVGELLQEARKEDPRIAESVPGVEAFHGSPFDFDRFDSSKIGEGEGAQSYGHGLYFAENRAVAEQYQKTAPANASPVEMRARNALVAVGGDFDSAIEQLKGRAVLEERTGHSPNEFNDAVEWLKEQQRVPQNLYKVHIAADRERFLDWDKPLSEQSEHLRNTLLNHPDPMIAGTAEKHGAVSGKDFYQRAEQHLRAQADDFPAPDEVDRTRPRLSGLLHEAGIPGIKYLDQGSRGEGEGTRNFVVFNDADIRITHKNGKEVGLDEMKASRPEIVPGPAPGTLRTGRPAVDALLHDPVVADAIANGPVDRAHDVPYEAGASEGSDPTTHLDSRLPRQVVLKSGTFDPAIPAKIHEQVEKRAMELLMAKKLAPEGRVDLDRRLSQKEINEIYETAHHEYAEVAEDAWYRSQGLDIDEVNAWWAKQDKITEHENPKNPPPDLYKKPYPHNQVEGVKHEEKGAAAEWPTNIAVEGGSAEGAGGNVVPLRRADWNKLADGKRAIDDPDAVAASKAAETTPEPESTEPAKAVSAAQAEATKADQLLADILPTLSEAERKVFETALADLKDDAEKREQIVRDGAACLAEAAA